MKQKNILGRAGLILLLLFILGSTNAQQNYLKGYVLNTLKDTVKGFINYHEWEKNPEKIKFKSSMEGKPETFRPLQILEFGVSDEIYVTAIVHSENSPHITNELDYDSRLKLKTDTVFLQSLVRGPKSLYYLKNKFGNDNLYIGTNTGFVLLEYKKYLKKHEGKRVVAQNNNYKGQLIYYLNGCPSLSAKINSLPYKPKSMTRIFKQYYGCTPAEIAFIRQTPQPKLEFGILAGASSTTIELHSAGQEELTGADFGVSNDFLGGLYLNLVLPRNREKWSLYSELLYSGYSFQTSYEDYRNEEYYTISNYDLGFSYLNLNVMVRFKLPFKAVNIFANGGLGTGFLISNTNKKLTEKRFYSSYSLKEGKVLEDIRSIEQGYILGAGAMYNNLSLEFRYERGNGFSPYTGLGTTTSKMFLLLGYRF